MRILLLLVLVSCSNLDIQRREFETKNQAGRVESGSLVTGESGNPAYETTLKEPFQN